jgi:hypothetical protein
MVKQHNAHAHAQELTQRQQRFQHAARLVLTAQEGRQRIDDEQVHPVLAVDGQGTVDQVEPLLLRRDGVERLGDEADAVAEVMLACPLRPQRRRFLRDDQRLAWPDGQAAETASRDAQAQQDGQERGFA